VNCWICKKCTSQNKVTLILRFPSGPEICYDENALLRNKSVCSDDYYFIMNIALDLCDVCDISILNRLTSNRGEQLH
jgi:hypothetical protein